MVIYRAKNSVGLCFDDGPNPKITPQILEVLKTKGVKATFFLIGARAEEYPGIVKDIVARRHEIGNHSYTHKHLVQLLDERGEETVLEEIEKSHKVIKQIAGISDRQLRYFRPPYLSWDSRVGKLAEPLYGNRIIMAHGGISDWDWEDDRTWNENDQQTIETKAGKIASNWRNQAKNGTILDFHDSAEYGLLGNKSHPNWQNRALPTLVALPKIIDDLKQKNLAIKTLSELELIPEPIAD